MTHSNYTGSGLAILERLNFDNAVSIPKRERESAESVEDFSPIYIFNSSIKIVSKLQNLVGDCQSGFIKVCNILESIVMAHETIYKIKEQKKGKKKRKRNFYSTLRKLIICLTGSIYWRC